MLQSKQYASRIAAIVRILMSADRHKMSIKSIHQHLILAGHSVTARQIQRDMQALEDHVAADEHKPKGYKLVEG